MAKAPKKVKPKAVESGSWFEPYMANYPPSVNPDWVEPELPEKGPQAAEVSTTHRVVLIGKYLHSVGINGTVRQYLGGEPLVVEENTYHILKDAGLIGKEF